MNLKVVHGKECPWHNLRYVIGICLKLLRKSINIYDQNGGYLDQDSSHISFECHNSRQHTRYSSSIYKFFSIHSVYILSPAVDKVLLNDKGTSTAVWENWIFGCWKSWQGTKAFCKLILSVMEHSVHESRLWHMVPFPYKPL